MNTPEPTIEDLTKRLSSMQRARKRERKAKEHAEKLLEDRSRELYHTQEELRTQLAYLSNVLGSIADGIIITSPEGEIRSVNDTMATLTGHAKENLVDKSLKDFITFDDQSKDSLQIILSPDFPAHAEASLITKNDRHRIVSISRAFVINEADEKDGVVISARDITEQKLADEERRLLSNAVLQTAEAILITDKDGTIEYVNPAFESITGYARHEALGKKPNILKSDKHTDDFYNELWQTILSGKTYRNILVNHQKDGMPYYSEKTITPIRNDQGDITHFVSSDRDITQRIENEEALRESENRFRSLVSQAADGFFVHDLTGQIIEVNQQACESLGYTEAELVGMNITQIESGVDLAQLQETLQNLKIGDTLTLESVHIRKDETTFPVEARIGAFELRGQKLILALARNISSRRQLEMQVVQSEKMASIGQLAAGVAHEINNPVGYITSNLGSLKDYVKVIKQLHELNTQLQQQASESDVLSQIQELADTEDIDFVMDDLEDLLSESLEGADRVKEIVNELKNFARVDESEIKEADINEGIESTLKVVWNELKYKANITKNLTPLPPIQCFPGQLNQVFMNLLVNAAQAMPDFGEITISTDIKDDNIVIQISDTGQGIPKESIARIFDPFYTTKEVGKGTGLGLSITHGIIKKHNGTIDIDSEVGKGTTFTIHIPVEGV